VTVETIISDMRSGSGDSITWTPSNEQRSYCSVW